MFYVHDIKEIEINMIMNNRPESLSKTDCFGQPFKDYHKTYSRKLRGIENAEQMIQETSKLACKQALRGAVAPKSFPASYLRVYHLCS